MRGRGTSPAGSRADVVVGPVSHCGGVTHHSIILHRVKVSLMLVEGASLPSFRQLGNWGRAAENPGDGAIFNHFFHSLLACNVRSFCSLHLPARRW